jgi:hypothetical protein
MQKSSTIAVCAVVVVMVIAGVVLSQPSVLAVSSSGSFNPQTQFPIGSTITFESLNGASAVRDKAMKPKFIQYTSSFTVTAQVENFTRDGGIRWKVLSGIFTINGQIYTVTSGDGHMNSFDEIASGMDGAATGPDGATYHWRLHGLATLYNGVVLVGLRGGIGTIESNHAILRYNLAYMATMSKT